MLFRSSSVIVSQSRYAVHTTFTGDSIKTLTPVRNVPRIPPSPTIAAFETTLRHHNTITEESHQEISQLLQHTLEFAESLDWSVLNTIAETKSYQRLLKKYVNLKISLGESISGDDHYINNLFEFAEQHSKKFVGYFLQNKEALVKLFSMLECISTIKESLLKQISTISDVKLFLESNHTFKPTHIEGVVLIQPDGKPLKLVNRLEFSRHNFLNNRG